MAWTDERIKLLKKLWQNGTSTVEIGRALGISKNAVVGKVHRLELPPRPSPLKSEGKKPLKRPVKVGHVALMDLKLTSCRWPIGDPKDPDFHFCGEQSVTGKPYCQEHCKIAYTSLKELSLQNALNKNAAATPVPEKKEAEAPQKPTVTALQPAEAKQSVQPVLKKTATKPAETAPKQSSKKASTPAKKTKK